MMPSPDALAVAVALAKRDLRRYFNNPTGYVFTTLFILLSAAAAFWRPAFFSNSLANLDPLNEAFPYLLLFFVPALTMGLWAEERKQGTDELLLTLPASENALVFGKFVAAAAIYLIALIVSLSHALVLAWLGRPDQGLLVANYLGFLLLGLALIPVAMLGSLLTSNSTIAFIIGTLLCAVPVGVGRAAATLSDQLALPLGPLGVLPYFSDFSRGVVSLQGVAYFVCLAAFFLYVNVLIVQRQRWRMTSGSMPPWAHAALRVTALALAMSAFVVLTGRTHARIDFTAEQLYSLTDQTRALIAGVPSDRPVLVQAFISRETPARLVQTRENLLGILREIEAHSQGKVIVSVQPTEPYSPEARLARERYNITPRVITDPSNGETLRDVYLGVAVTSGAEEQIIPFLDPGLSPEFELARAVRVITRAGRKRVGIIDTDVKMLGGVDYRTSQARQQWAAVRELRAQYDLVEVTPADAASAPVDALVIVQPSRLTQTDLDFVMEPVTRGVPTLVLLDPLPMVDMRLAPAADLAMEINPYETKPRSRLVFGDIRAALDRIGINWTPARIAWDVYNPHPDLAEVPRETVFVASGNGNPDALNRRNPVTAGLEEVLLLYPGYLLPGEMPGFTFEPLLQTGKTSGASSFFDVVSPTPRGLVINTSLTREADERQYVLAARVRSQTPVAASTDVRSTDVIAIADIDFISDAFFNIRAMAQANADFDNIALFSNAIDLLTGDHSFIALRNRRGRHRTLERVEAQTQVFMEQRTREEQQAQQEALRALEEARNRLKTRLEELNARTDLDGQAKQIMMNTLKETEERQLRLVEQNITEARDTKIRASRETMEIQVRNIRTRIRTLAVLLPPLPMLLFGCAVFARRTRREHEATRLVGRLRKVA